MQVRKKERKKKQTNRQTDRQTDRQTNRQTTDRLTKPFKSSRFPKMFLRTNNREQTSRLEIWELNLIFPVPVPIFGNGKIKKLSVCTAHGTFINLCISLCVNVGILVYELIS
jgi:hypothetical protein